MRALTWIGILTIAACASQQTGGPSTNPGPQPVLVTGGGGGVSDIAYTPDGAMASMQVVHAPVDRVWGALPGVYKDLGLELTESSTASHALSGQRVRTRGTFAGVQFSQFIDCGETAGIPNALRYEINLTVSTSLRAATDSTLVSTTVSATGKPGEFSGQAVPCAANGEIAIRITKALRNATK
jgi:hypothetical protein